MGIGILRVILALTVVITHTHPIYGFTLGNPTIAVRAFFILSGFYMGLILSGKYRHYKNFIVNRFLKIYPIYWAVLFLTVLSSFVAYIAKHDWADLTVYSQYLHILSPSTFLLFITTNLALLGRSIVMFSGLNEVTGNIFFNSSNIYHTYSWPFLLVPQAWTLELELLFYLIAPFLVRRKTHTLFIILLVAISIRFFTYKFGLTSDYWTYRFFPNEACFFILGLVSFNLYKKLKSYNISSYVGSVGTLIVIFLLSFFGYFNVDFDIKQWGFYIILAALIPIIFIASEKNKFDRTIGDLSYSIYITHILVVASIIGFFKLYISDLNLLAPVTFLLTFIVSIFLVRYIQNPIEKLRKRILKAEMVK